MTDPSRLFTMTEGAEAGVARDLDVARRSPPWSRDQRVASYWAIRRRAAPPPRSAARIAGWAVSGAALAAAALWVLVSPLRGHLGGEAHLASSPSAPVANGATGSAQRWPGASGDGWTQFEIAGLGVFEASRSAGVEILELEAERQLRMRPGTLRAQVAHQDPDRPVVVVTPHVRVVVVGTRFDVVDDGQRTTVQVLEGLVRVETSGRQAAVFVPAGNAVDSDDPRLQVVDESPASPSSAPRAAPGVSATARPSAAAGGDAAELAAPVPGGAPLTLEGCEARKTLEARERCLLRLSNGKGLPAQNALFALAMLAGDQPDGAEEAYETFRRYEQLYPGGALAAEAALKQIEMLRRLGRTRDAQAVAARFQERFGSDPRASAVAVVRAQLMCGRPDQRPELERLLEQLSANPEPPIRRAADELRGRCNPAPLSPAPSARPEDDELVPTPTEPN